MGDDELESRNPVATVTVIVKWLHPDTAAAIVVGVPTEDRSVG